jgi:endonuclease-3
VCLENTSVEDAQAAYARLYSIFHDLNEVRVSSITELAPVFDGIPEAERRALGVRNVLRYVFEKNYQFSFENLRKKTLEQATKQLGRIKDVSPFVRTYILQEGLGSHLVPADEAMCRAAAWLGLVEPGLSPEAASEALKAAVRKADARQFCELLRCLATDPLVRDAFRPKGGAPQGGYDLQSAPSRLTDLLASASTRAKKKPAGKAADRKPRTTKKPAARHAPGTARKKAAAKTKKKK